jgi:hypothetical protein
MILYGYIGIYDKKRIDDTNEQNDLSLNEQPMLVFSSKL